MSYKFSSGDSILYDIADSLNWRQNLSFNFFIKFSAAIALGTRFWGRFDYPPVSGLSFQLSGGDNQDPLMYIAQGSDTAYWTVGAPTLLYSTWLNIHYAYDGTQADGGRTGMWMNGTPVSGFDNTSGFTGNGGSSNPLGLFGDADSLIAEFAWWGATINDSGGMISAIATGTKASSYPTNLEFYAPLEENANDTIGPITGTVSGATLDADHPFAGSGGAVGLRSPIWWNK